MPPKKVAAAAAALTAATPPLPPSCAVDHRDLPALTRLPTVTNETSALLRGPSFMQSIDQHRRSKRQTAALPVASARSTAASSVASVPARLSLVPGIQGGPTTTAAAAASSTSSPAVPSPSCRPMDAAVQSLRREPTMLHSGDRLVPSMSPERDMGLVSTEDDGMMASASGSGTDGAVAAASDYCDHATSTTTTIATTTAMVSTTATTAITAGTPPAARRYTVVLDLDETVVYGRDGELVARAHLKNFIRSVGTATELIVWTAGERSYAKQVVREINEDGVIRHCIYRDKVWFDAKDYTKNLARLGRDPQHVLVVENTPECVRENPQNGIIVSDFEGGKGEADRTLLLLSHLVLDMVKAQRPVPEYLAASKALKRQLVPSGDGARRIPIFFLSARAKVPGLEPAAARASDASVSMSVGSLLLDDEGEVTLAQVVAEAQAAIGSATTPATTPPAAAASSPAATTKAKRTAAANTSEDVKIVKVNRDAAPKQDTVASKKTAPATAAAGKRPDSGAVASALLLASKARAPTAAAASSATSAVGAATAAAAARVRAVTTAAAAATSTVHRKTAAAAATAKADKTAPVSSSVPGKKVAAVTKPAGKASTAPAAGAKAAASSETSSPSTAATSAAKQPRAATKAAPPPPPPKPAGKAASKLTATETAGARRQRS